MGEVHGMRSNLSELIPIASSLYTLHEGRQVREEGIAGGKLLRALCDLGVKALGFWYKSFERAPTSPALPAIPDDLHGRRPFGEAP